MWYDGNDALSKNRLYTFVIGNRGGGKTFFYQRWCIKDFIKNYDFDKKQCLKPCKFIWLRRYESEIKEIKDKWCATALMNEFPNHEITFKGKKIYVNGHECGVMMALSTHMRSKSVAFDQFDKIIFDEFILDKCNIRYLSDECLQFNDFFETVNRLSDRVRAIFIANAISIVNPYFTFYNIKPDIGREFTMYRDILIQLYKNSDYVEAKKKTRFGRLNSNNRYGEYSIDNAFLRDDYNFIKERPKDLIYLMTILYNKEKFGAWYDKGENIYYFDNIIEPLCKNVLCVNMSDLEEKAYYKKSDIFKPRTEILKIYFNEGRLYFSDVVVKKNIYEVIKIV